MKNTPTLVFFVLALFGFLGAGSSVSAQGACLSSLEPPVLTSPTEVRGLRNGDAINYQITYEADEVTDVEVTDVRGLPEWWNITWDSETDQIVGRIPPVTSAANQMSFTVFLESSIGDTKCEESSTRVTVFWSSEPSRSTPISPSAPDQQAPLNPSYFEDLSGSYIQNFLRLFGAQPQSSSSSPDTNSADYQSCPPETEQEIKVFQCQQGIVCSGTKETTGYGNLGPKTRAKIYEIYPVTARRACSADNPYSPPNPNPNPNPNPDPSEDPFSNTVVTRVVKDIQAIGDLSPSEYTNIPGLDKCQAGNSKLYQIGYDGGERVLFCKFFDNLEYVPGSTTALVVTDAHMIYPSRGCHTLGEDWVKVPGKDGIIDHCQKLEEINYKEGSRKIRTTAFVMAVNYETSSSPIKNFLRSIRRTVIEAIKDVVESSGIGDHLDDLERYVPDIKESRFQGKVNSLRGSEIDDVDVDELYVHDKADKMFLEVKPTYLMDVGEGDDPDGTDDQPGVPDSGDRPGGDDDPIVRGVSTNLSIENSLSVLQSILNQLSERAKSLQAAIYNTGI